MTPIVNELAERIAIELCGWTRSNVYIDGKASYIDKNGEAIVHFNPLTAEHATMVMEALPERDFAVAETKVWCDRYSGNQLAGAQIYLYDDIHISACFSGHGKTWMEALCDAVISYLDSIKDDQS